MENKKALLAMKQVLSNESNDLCKIRTWICNNLVGSEFQVAISKIGEQYDDLNALQSAVSSVLRELSEKNGPRPMRPSRSSSRHEATAEEKELVRKAYIRMAAKWGKTK